MSRHLDAGHVVGILREKIADQILHCESTSVGVDPPHQIPLTPSSGRHPRLRTRSAETEQLTDLRRVHAGILAATGRPSSPALRTLDSLHLAVAFDLGDDLESIVTYDDRRAEAAAANGVLATTPT